MTGTYARTQPYGITLIRLALGASMFYHGLEKLLPPPGLHGFHPLASFSYFGVFVASLGMPAWLAPVSILTEFLGGLCLLLGLFTRPAAAIIAVNMLVALITVNRHHGLGASEYTIALILMALALILTGPGALALARLVGRSRNL